MGVLKNFSLEVDPSTNPNGVYYTGQVVTGVVQINLKEPIRMRGIRLTFTGAANVKWTKISGEKRENYKSKEKYVDQTIVIYGKAVGDKGDAQTHPAGLYRYPFRVQIPANIPSTFSGKFGHIAYSLKATMDKPWKLNSNTKPLVLTIHKYIDLNREPNAHIAPQGQASLDIRRLCCFSGSVQVTCSTSKSGYTPGETVVVHSQIENSSGKRLHSLHAKLTKEVTYHDTKGSSHKHSELVTDTKLSPVPQPEKDFWSGHLQLELPATATPFRLDNCNIIDLRYKVLFTVTVKGGNKVRAELPVSVGSEPVPVPGHNRDNVQRSQSWSPVTLEHNPFPPTLNGTLSSKQRQQFPIPGAPAPSLSHVFYNHHQPHAQTMQFVPPPYLINNQTSGEPYPGPSANPVFMSIPRPGISHQISPPAEFGRVPPQHPERPPLLPTAPPPYSP